MECSAELAAVFIRNGNSASDSAIEGILRMTRYWDDYNIDVPM